MIYMLEYMGRNAFLPETYFEMHQKKKDELVGT